MNGNKYAGGRAGFATGPFDVSVNYGQTEVTPLGGEDKFKTFGAGAAYDFSVVKLFAYYTQSKLDALKLQNYSLGASVPLGLGLIRAQVTPLERFGHHVDRRERG